MQYVPLKFTYSFDYFYYKKREQVFEIKISLIPNEMARSHLNSIISILSIASSSTLNTLSHGSFHNCARQNYFIVNNLAEKENNSLYVHVHPKG